MTPAARIAAAAEILDRVLAGTAAEKALTNWARASRFAGSGDRAAVRDHVFTALRCRRSHAALGGAETGRGLMLGQLREAGTDPETLFTGAGYAPAPLSATERAHLGRHIDLPRNVALDCPDWLAPGLATSLGPRFAPVMEALRHRAPVFLRVNTLQTDLEGAQAALAADGIGSVPRELVKTALEVTSNARRIYNSTAYEDGLVELQDLASQASVGMLPTAGKTRILDYCAGGGGKALALAAAAPTARVYAHDTAPGRMADLPRRAARATARITCLAPDQCPGQAPFDLVLCDAPCSGSGAWRRSPEAKWRLDRARLDELVRVQSEILDTAAALVSPGGVLAYTTCSLLEEENNKQIYRFIRRNSCYSLSDSKLFTPLDGGDGFFVAILMLA